MTEIDPAWELGQRRAIRRDLGLWCEHALAPQGLAPAAHHRLLIRELQAVADGVHDRLAVFMPPGSAKSTYASDLFPAWFFAQGRDRRIIATSNTADLAGAFSRRVRGRIRSHGLTLGYKLEREAEDLWTTSNGGEYRAAGIGGVITGLRADLALVDDPVKSREEADSESRRNRVWEWFQDDLRTRLCPGAAIVVVQTRWHQDDLAGRLLEAQPGKWRVVSLPAEAEVEDPLGRAPGELLWSDDAYGYAASLARMKTEANTRSWSALYQQRPIPDSGDYFRSEWLHLADTLPDRSTLRVYGGSDYAVTANGGDYTVHAVIGMDPGGKLWLLDLWRKQAAADAWIEAFCDLVRHWRPIGWAEETGQIRAGLGPFLERRMRERQTYVARHAFPTRGDKAVRAQSIRGRMALDGLHVPRHAPWLKAFEAELLTFPAGRHDDQVDAIGLVGQLLNKMTCGPTAKDKKPALRDRYSRMFEEPTYIRPTDWRNF